MLGRLDDVTVLPTSAILNYAAGTDPARACRDWGLPPLTRKRPEARCPLALSMHLFDAMTQKSISSEHHDFDLENVFDVQDEIGRLVVESLRKRFPPTVPKSRDWYSSDPEAYTEFMAGLRDSYSDGRKRSRAPSSTCRRRSSATRVRVCSRLAVLRPDERSLHLRPAARSIGEAEHHCRRALMLDPGVAGGYLARAFILWGPAKNFTRRSPRSAGAGSRRPTKPRAAHNQIASICMHIGRLQEARIAHEQAQRSNPKTRSGNLSGFFSAAATSRVRKNWPRRGFEEDRERSMRSTSTHSRR